MKDYLNYINDCYPIRRTKEEKEKFRDYIINEVKNSKYNCNVETLENKHNNIIIGNVEKANVVFTAHYDTPATSLIPNLMLPRNKVLGMIYHLGFPIVLSILSLVIAYFISHLITDDIKITVILYLIIYLSSFYLLTRCFKNKHNKNDNTSGVATILEIISKSNNDNVAFILFDDEEKGLLGSKAYNRAHKDIISNKLVINFDCVGLGNYVLFIAKEGAMKHKLYDSLVQNNQSKDDYNVLFHPFKGSFANSDYKNFCCGVGVMSCKKAGKNIYYTSKIHTNKDNETNNKNIDFISNNMIRFINEAL